MAKKTAKPSPKPARVDPETVENAYGLNRKQELFCRFYTQNGETFGNGTDSYAEAYDFKLDELSTKDVYGAPDEDGNREKIDDSPYDKAERVCASNASRLLRIAKIQARITTLLNEVLKDEIVDSQLAKLVMQDRDNTNKIAAIREYNKLRGRIIDKTQNLSRLPFGEEDIGVLIATLPQERQDYFYGIIKQLIDEAELQRRSGTSEGGVTR